MVVIPVLAPTLSATIDKLRVVFATHGLDCDQQWCIVHKEILLPYPCNQIVYRNVDYYNYIKSSFLEVRLHGYGRNTIINYSQNRSSEGKTDLIKWEASQHSDMKAFVELCDVSHICNWDKQNVVESMCIRHECICTVDLVHTVYSEDQ